MDLDTVVSTVGLVGSAMVIVAYFSNQQGWMSSSGLRYSLANLVGASLILFSLTQTWNLPAAVMEGFWAAISLNGIVRWMRARISRRR